MTFQIRRVSLKEAPFPVTDQHPQARRYQFGELWVDAIGEITAESFAAYQLADSKQSATAEIERAAETRREALTSAGAGKRDAYLLKYELLLRAIKDDPDPAAIQMLAAEAQARGLSPEAHATSIASKRQAWEQAAMAIETAEATFKAAVSDAGDRDAVSAAVDAARAAFDAIGG